MRIGIDIDDTIFTCVTTMLDYINKRLPVNLKMEDISTYWLEDHLPEEYQWIVENGFHDKNFWKNIQPIPYAATVILSLMKAGHEVYFVTASLPENLKKKMRFLGRFLGLDEEVMRLKTINIRRKNLLKLDVLIDDSRVNITSGDYIGIALKYPWNAPHNDVDNHYYFADNWKQIAAILRELQVPKIMVTLSSASGPRQTVEVKDNEEAIAQAILEYSEREKVPVDEVLIQKEV